MSVPGMMTGIFNADRGNRELSCTKCEMPPGEGGGTLSAPRGFIAEGDLVAERHI